MNRLIASAALAATLLLPGAPLRALEMRVAMIQLDPWTMPDPHNPHSVTGIVPDLMRELEKRTGHHITGIMTPYARVEADLEAGRIDFSFMAWGPQRARYANKGVDAFPLAFGILPVKGVALKSYADLKGIAISVTRGLKVDPVFDADNTLNKAGDLDYTLGVKKANVGRVQAVAGSLSTIRHIALELGVNERFGEPLVLKTTVAAISYSKKSPHPEQEKVIDEAMKQIIADGTMLKIRDKWLRK
jgi:polar amino acid transport system substrate-binding protein